VKQKECIGEIILTNNQRYDSRLVTYSNKSNNWYRGRGKLFIDLKNSSTTPMGKQTLGTFYCKKPQHNKNKHIYLLTNTDIGQIVKLGRDKTEFVQIEVTATLVADETIDYKKPKVSRF